MADLKIDAAIEPFENDGLVYLPVAPPASKEPGSGMVNFLLTLTYRGFTGGDPGDLTAPPPPSVELEGLTVAFPDSEVSSTSYPASGTLVRDKPFTLHLDQLRTLEAPKERGSIRIPSLGHSTIEIYVKCADIAAVTFTWPLAPHLSPTVNECYSFPLKAKDLGEEQYIAPGAGHLSSRSQHYAHDIGGVQWDGESFVNDTGKQGNAGKVIWEKPVYAMADGIVLRVENDQPDNPSPGRRTVVRGGRMERGPAGLVSVATAGSSRIFSAVTDAGGHVLMLAFAPSADSDSLEFLGKSAPQLPFAGTEISLAAISTRRAITACAAGGGLVLNSWKISKDGKTIAPDGELTISNTAAAKVTLLPRADDDDVSPDRFVLVRQRPPPATRATTSCCRSSTSGRTERSRRTTR